MSKYDIFATSMSNLVGLGPIFHSLWHMFPVRLILSEVLNARSGPLNLLDYANLDVVRELMEI